MEETFKYRVELDTQGLAGQLAGVRDFISNGLGQAAQGAVGGVQMAGGAVNRLSSDIMQGQQMIASSLPAQMMSAVPAMGIGSTPLANVPGMPQSFMQEAMAMAGLQRPPVGVFGSQQQMVARTRMQERITVGVSEGVSSAVGMSVFGGLGAAVGSAFSPVGTILGSIAGTMLGDTVLAPITQGVERRIQDRAQVQQLFGFNKFSEDQRMAVTDFMGQRLSKSLFSPEDFNSVLPAAAKAGFFKGMGKGDVAGFGSRFAAAEQTLMEDMYALQVTGPEGMMVSADARQGFSRLGVSDQRTISRHFKSARVIAQDMADIGEYADPQEVMQAQVAAGSTAMQFGISAKAGMNTFNRQAAMVTNLRSSGNLSDDDFASLGGSTTEVAGRLTSSLMASQRHPVFRAAAMAFGDMSGGVVGINRAAMEAGGMSFASMTERLSQQLGTGSGGTTRMMTLMANQGKIQGDMMANQGQMLRGMTDDILRQANLEVTDGTRQFVMQKVFGVAENESRALVSGLPMEKADQARQDKDIAKFDSDVKDALKSQEGSAGRVLGEMGRDLKETFAKPLDKFSDLIAKIFIPSIDKAVERLGSIGERTGTLQSSRSPISSGSIDFSGNDGTWMVPADPASMQGFRAVSESRRFPAPLSLSPVSAPMLGTLPGMSGRSRESMAG
jgi:hypothetical protein